MATAKKNTLKRKKHSMPAFVGDVLDERGLMDAYEARPAYQRNDYLGWIKSAKLDATRQKRLGQMLTELKSGKRYMNMAWSGGRSQP